MYTFAFLARNCNSNLFLSTAQMNASSKTRSGSQQKFQTAAMREKQRSDMQRPYPAECHPLSNSSRIALLLLSSMAIAGFVLTPYSPFTSLAFAQQIRAELKGKVIDSTGANINGAQVTVLETETGVQAHTVSNKTGDFDFPYLTPGHYVVTVEKQGFKKYQKSDIQLQVSDNIALTVGMEIGESSTTITVNANSDQLRTGDADLGTVIESRQLEDLPVKDNNPLLMATLSAGVIDFANLSSGGQTQTFTSSTPSSISINGVPYNGANGGNSYLLDGAPNVAGNNASTGQNQAFSPTNAMVQQFRIQTTSYDLSAGFGPGATIGLNLKSGTNILHGEVDETAQNRLFNANDWFSNNAGLPKQDNRQQDWDLVLTGPVELPKLYNGKDKTFFMFGYQGISSKFPKTLNSISTTMTQAERNGDLTVIFGKTPSVYNPYSTAPNGSGHVKRTAFGAVPGCPVNAYGVPTGPNVIPFGCTVNGHLFKRDPYAEYIMNAHMPMPNYAGASTKADQENNYITNRYQTNWYTAFVTRIDHQINEHHSIFGHYYHSHLDEDEQIAFNNGLGSYFYRSNQGLDLDDVYQFSSSLVLNTRASASRYKQETIGATQGEDLTKTGLSANYISQIQTNDPGHARLPDTAVSGLTELSTTGYTNLPSTIWSIGANLTWVRGNHLIKTGAEYRRYLDNGANPGNDAGKMSYAGNYTNSSDTASTSTYGLGVASFLMGIPSSGSINTAGSYAEADTMLAFYFGDSWRVNRRLTVNYGLRYENQRPMTERYNRTITQFDTTSANPLQAKAQAKYVSTGSPLLPTRLNVLGGPLFAGAGTAPSFWHQRNLEGFQPRLAIAFRLNDKTVIRSGYGVYDIITRMNPIQTGFSQTTSVITSNDQGLTYVASSEDPFPATNPILPPSGASGGLATGAGSSITAITSNLRRPYEQRWSLGVERSLGAGTILSVAYVGNRGTKLWSSREYDPIPRQYLSTLPVRDTATINALSQKVANPFFGLIAGQSLGTSSTVAVSQLLMPFPQFSGITVNENNGYSYYHSLQTEARKRFSNGLSFGSAWTWSRTMDCTGYLNDTDARPEKVISQQDRLMRWTLNGIYELPVGEGRRFFGTAHGITAKVISGWQVQSTYALQAGKPNGFGDAIFTGNVNKDINLPSDKKSVKMWFNPTFFDNNSKDELSDNIQTFPSRFSQVRGPRSNLMNLAFAKNTRFFGERLNFQFRTDFINALNHANFADPSTGVASSTWGVITGTNSTPRVVQFHGKFIF